MAPDERPLMAITLVFAHGPHQLETEPLQLPAGACVRDACAASQLLQRLGAASGSDLQAGLRPGDTQAGLRLALWGRLCGPDTRLQPGDRLELLRGLQADPMEARRQRLRRDGLRKVQRSPRKTRGV